MYEISEVELYKVIEKSDKNDLEEKVTHFIEKGWYPLGGVSYNNYIFYQAMINVLEIKNIKLKKDE